MAKATKHEINTRVNTVVSMLGRGLNRMDIVQYAAKNWHVESRQTDAYIARARDIIKERFERNSDEWICDIMASYDEIFKHQMNGDKGQKQDYRGAKLTLDSMVKLLVPQSVNVNLQGGVKTDVNVPVVVAKYDAAIKAALESLQTDE